MSDVLEHEQSVWMGNVVKATCSRWFWMEGRHVQFRGRMIKSYDDSDTGYICEVNVNYYKQLHEWYTIFTGRMKKCYKLVKILQQGKIRPRHKGFGVGIRS